MFQTDLKHQVNKSTKTNRTNEKHKKSLVNKTWIQIYSMCVDTTTQISIHLNLQPGHMRGRKESPGSAKTPPVSDLRGEPAEDVFVEWEIRSEDPILSG